MRTRACPDPAPTVSLSRPGFVREHQGVTGALRDARILVTGATGQVALPVARALAADNEVIAVARFKDEAKRAALEAAGIECVSVDLARGDMDAIPDDVDYVCNFAVVKSNRWDVDLAG